MEVNILFKPPQVNDLTFSAGTEVIRTNRAGAYLSTTTGGLNTRKYHGLLIVPIEQFGGEKHVLLSSLDETIIQQKTEFPLGVRRYANDYIEQKGYRYMTGMHFSKIPVYTYQAGGVTLHRERLLVENEQQVLIRYTLAASAAPVILRLKPYAAFRNIHSLSKANSWAQTGYEAIDHGIRIRMYEQYPWLTLQMSKPVVFNPAPDWYYQVEYEKEKARGYDYLEDLFSPGTFDTELKPGESVVFMAGVNPADTSSLKQRFYNELRKRPEKKTLSDFLKNAATQFIWHKGDQEDIMAGYPWYDSLSRQTFISLPGLRLTQSDRRLGMSVLDTYAPYIRNGLFPKSIGAAVPEYDNADTSLWFIWAIQQFRKQGCRIRDLSTRYGNIIKSILETLRQGTHNVNMLESGLLFAAEQGRAYTWMDSYAYGKPVVPRYGMPVEINALWYNAIRFALDIAAMEGDSEFIARWRKLPDRIEEAFLKAYWDDEKGYLADVYNGFYTDWSVRPNMVIAAAMDYTPLSKDQLYSILKTAEQHLLTPRGLRTLSPADSAYQPFVSGTPDERESAVHTGAVHPWLLMFYADATLKVHKKSGIAVIRKLVEGFAEEMSLHCLGTLSEMYDGDPPHHASGALSQAWNVAALLTCFQLLFQAEKSNS
jgi:predicted glycogen debranching enzyme